MEKTLFVDLDDTLIPTTHDYSIPQMRFAFWVIDDLKHAAPNPLEILTLLDDFDHKDAKLNGFGKERFPRSMVKTYVELCRRAGKRASMDKRDEVYSIGMAAFDWRRYKKKSMFPGVQKTLHFLKKQGDELILVTKGDEDVQRKKIKAKNLERWFDDRIYIVPRKSPELFDELTGNRDRSKVYSIGNSYKSDIAHALDVGLGGIYVPFSTWSFEHHGDEIPEHPRLLELPNKDFKGFRRIIDNYNSFP